MQHSLLYVPFLFLALFSFSHTAGNIPWYHIATTKGFFIKTPRGTINNNRRFAEVEVSVICILFTPLNEFDSVKRSLFLQSTAS